MAKLLAASILALAAAQEYHEHTGLKILSKDGARIHQNEPERHALGADGHGVYRPPRPILGRDGHGVATTMPNLTRALLITQTSYCMADADAPLSPAELSATVEVTAVHEHEGARAVIGWDNATKSAWVSFRGTENLENWWDNIQFEKTTPYPAPYFRCVDVPWTSRGDAAAATWIFRRDESGRRRRDAGRTKETGARSPGTTPSRSRRASRSGTATSSTASRPRS